MDYISVGFESTGDPLEGYHVTAKGLNGLLHKVIRDWNAEEAEWFHSHPAPKPFALVPYYNNQGLLAGLRIAALTDHTADILHCAWEAAQRSGRPLRLGRHLHFRARDWERVTGPTFQALADTQPRREMALEFLAPTAFRQGPGYLNLPLPRNVFASPLRIWNAFAGRELLVDEQWLDWCERNVFVTDHDIHTVSIPLSRRARFTGFVGRVQYEAVRDGRREMAIWQALGNVATYCGIGHRATMGMGAVRLLEPVDG